MPPIARRHHSYTVSLDPELAAEFERIGGGNRSRGIRLVYLLLKGRKERLGKGQLKRAVTLRDQRIIRSWGKGT
jgi:hypothetical protein